MTKETVDAVLCALRQEIGSRQAEAVRDLIDAKLAEHARELHMIDLRMTGSAPAPPAAWEEINPVKYGDWTPELWNRVAAWHRMIVAGRGDSEVGLAHDALDNFVAALAEREYLRGWHDFQVRQMMQQREAAP